ncbi:TPA: hypothetical protein SGD24_000291 [Staphylococcus aureus]|nr:hypothetical protein [Staphylococcus aureus]
MNCYDEIYNTIKKLIENKEITSYQINKDTGISYGNINEFVNNFYFENIEYKMFDSLKEVNNFIEKTYKFVLHLGLDKKERLKKTEKELLTS